MNKKILIFLLMIIIPVFLLNPADTPHLSLIKGSNIYIRIFLFFFPISNAFDSFSMIEDDSLISELTIKKDDIKSEPSTPPVFETDLNIRIKDIPLQSGNYTLNVTLRCNKKVNFKDVNFIVYKKDKLLILKGFMSNLLLNEISDNEYFKKRLKWKFPLYFDLRYRID
jgi:hypothetical protein